MHCLYQALDLSGANVPDDLKTLLEEYKEQRKAVCVSCYCLLLPLVRFYSVPYF